MAELEVRAYNVRFGDAVLVSIPDRSATRHLLIDMGNSLSREGGVDSVFEPVIEDILVVLDGRPLDLYVMTHEHLDHVQGLLFASERLGIDLKVRHAWLTGSADPDYYDTHDNARRQKLEAQRIYSEIGTFLAAEPEHSSDMLDTLLRNNSAFAAAGSSNSTEPCVEYLRQLADHTTYVHREAALAGRNPFREAKIEIWAPEEDTADYYGRFQPMALAGDAMAISAAGPAFNPPSGVDAGTFMDLVESRRDGFADNLLAIDKASNNTSVVLCLEWRGWRLLFTGDAEERSWKEMNKHDVLKPVHFLKVGHHGSHNGTPEPELLDKILPHERPDDRLRRAIVSTCENTYCHVPDKATLDEIGARCDELRSTEEVADGEAILMSFPG